VENQHNNDTSRPFGYDKEELIKRLEVVEDLIRWGLIRRGHCPVCGEEYPPLEDILCGTCGWQNCGPIEIVLNRGHSDANGCTLRDKQERWRKYCLENNMEIIS
jgi:hypothetical protein